MKLSNDQQAVVDAVVSRKYGKVLVMNGPAGCGKSEIIKEVSRNIKALVLVAPTGAAAAIIGGRTLHRAFGIPTVHPINPDFKTATLQSQRFIDPATKFFGGKSTDAIKAAEWIIIDEHSMIRCDLLDAVDESLKRIRDCRQPFGGACVLLCGDLGQAVPVAIGNDVKILESYGYSFPFGINQSKSLANADAYQLELTKIFRQSNPAESSILSRIRSGEQTQDDLDVINERVSSEVPREAVIISPLNAVVDHFNNEALSKMRTRRYKFVSSKTGTMKKKRGPLPDEIVLAEGCRVIIKANFTDRDGVSAVNGDCGTFLGVEDGKLLVQLDRNGWTVLVSARNTPENTWVVSCDEDGDTKIETKPVGKFVQYPIALGYAISVHASQGSTIEKVHLFLSHDKPFTYSLTYVGLSRIKSFSGLTINRKITSVDIRSSLNFETATRFVEAKSNNQQGVLNL